MAIYPVIDRPREMGPLCPQLTENHLDNISSNESKALLYRIAAIVSAIALTTLFTFAAATYFGVLAAQPVWVTGVCMVGAMTSLKGLDLWHEGTTHYEIASHEKKLVEKIEELKAQGPDTVEQFLREVAIEPAIIQHLKDDIPALAAQSPDAPLNALLPLVAHYKLGLEKATHFDEIAKENFGKIGAQQAPEPAEDVEAPERPVLNIADRQYLDFSHFCYGMSAIESQARANLNCALLIQNIINPTKIFSIGENDRGEVHILSSVVGGQEEQTDHGILTTKEMQHRLMEFVEIPDLIDPKPRTFFTPLVGHSLGLDYMRTTAPHEIRARIFG